MRSREARRRGRCYCRFDRSMMPGAAAAQATSGDDREVPGVYLGSLHEKSRVSYNRGRLRERSKFLWRLVAFACDPRSPKFMQSPPIESYRGWWTIPYFSCKTRRWLVSYSVNVKSPDVRPGLVRRNPFRDSIDDRPSPNSD